MQPRSVTQARGALLRTHLHVDDDCHVARVLEMAARLPDEQRAHVRRLGGGAVRLRPPGHWGSVADAVCRSESKYIVRHGDGRKRNAVVHDEVATRQLHALGRGYGYQAG